jgi:hypothetical protein
LFVWNVWEQEVRLDEKHKVVLVIPSVRSEERGNHWLL